MKIVILAIIIAFAAAELHPVRHDLVNEIKASATWTPMEPEENPFYMVPIEKIKAMMGTKLTVEASNVEEDETYVPNDEFDSRTAWPGKVHEIRNQGQCGSCWAFGATEALSDRLYIEQGVDVVLSPQHLVSCDTGNYGCQGGYLNVAWNFMQKTGVMTDACYPYTSGTSGDSGSCKSTCADGSKPTFYHSSSAAHPTSVSSTQKELSTNGPMEAAFTVYEDFMSYKSGVYEHKTGSMLGGHAIKLLGWGTESGTDYWLLANSWGTSWGDNGFFKIKRGDCGINAQMYGGLANKPSMETTE